MTNLTKTLPRLAFLCVLLQLVRFTQFCLELSELNWEAGEVSNAELFLHNRIKQLLTPINA